MEIVWEIIRYALGITISALVLTVAALWLWFSVDGWGKLQLSVVPLVLGVGLAQGLFGVIGGLGAAILLLPVFWFLVRRIV
jgi:hypothetical protein